MLEKRAAETFLRSLDRLEAGSLNLTLPDGRTYQFQGIKSGPSANMFIEKWCVPASIAQSGDVGMAETYRNGHWQTDDLQSLMTLALQNENHIRNYIMGNPIARMIDNMSYFFRRNSLKGSKRNIHAHYDLGNDFYQLWLDPTMTYSSALYKKPDEDLMSAQYNKYDRIVDSLESRSGSILEIGCGWGGFADRALQKGDFSLKGLTLSTEQKNFAQDRVGGRASIVLEDYRTEKGQYDNIVSIEMFEAVGEKYWPEYFSKISQIMKKSGRAVVQTITIEEKRFQSYRRGSDFIRSFIFPGGMLPSASRFVEEAGKAGLRAGNRLDFGGDYAKTLEVWLRTFDEKTDSIRSLGFDDGFIRLWRFYLSTCIAGFRTGRTNVMQIELCHA